MKGMCHSLGARVREEIGGCQSREEGWSCMAASPESHLGFPGDLTRPRISHRSRLLG